MDPDANSEPVRPVLLATAEGYWELDEDADALGTALASFGIAASPANWRDGTIDWAGAGLVVVRSTWDYTTDREAFVRWAESVQRCTRLENPAEVIRWNTDKRYLGDLVDAGVPVVPTTFVEPVDAARLPELLEVAAGHGEFVLKPTVSAGSKDTARFADSETERAGRLARSILERGRVLMIQPYQHRVDTEGETGLVYFNGSFSHAFNKGQILKRGAEPEPGRYAEPQITAAVARDADLEVADAVVSHVIERFGHTPLYARVDMVDGDPGHPLVMELELTEPAWFLSSDPGAAARAAAAIADRLDP